MQRSLQSMSLQRGVNLNKTKLYYSGNYHFIDDMTLLVIAKIPSLTEPVIFDGQYNYTSNQFSVNYNSTGYMVNLVNKIDPDSLSDGECIIFVNDADNGTFLVSSISLTTIELSNADGDKIYGEWSPLGNIGNAFTQIINITNTVDEIDAFFSKPVYDTSSSPKIDRIELSNKFAENVDIDALNANRVIPSKFIGNKNRLDFYYDISKKPYIGDRYISNFLSIPDTATVNSKFTKVEVDNTFYGFQFVSTNSVIMNNSNNTISIKLDNGDGFQQFDCVVFVGFDDGYNGNVAERYKIKYKISKGLSPLPDGSNTIILESFDYVEDLSKKPNNPFTFSKDTTFSEPVYKDKYSWDHKIDSDSYDSSSENFPSNIDGSPLFKSLFSSLNSGHVVFSLNSFISNADGTITAPFESTLVGDFFVEIEIKDKILNKVYTSSVTLNVSI